MKTLNLFKYLLIFALGTTLMFSCSDEEFSDTTSDTIQLRGGEDELPADEDWDTDGESTFCEVKVCATLTPNPNSSFTDVLNIVLPTIGTVQIFGGFVYVPGEPPVPLVDNQFCQVLPIFGPTTATLIFTGAGTVEVTGEWENGAICPLFDASGLKAKEPIKAKKEITLTCDSPCPPPPDCFIDVCVVVNAADNNDVFQIQYPTIGVLSIINGNVTLPNGDTDVLDANNEYCATIPIFGPVTAFVSFFGEGDATVIATYENEQDCTVFQAGIDTDDHTCAFEAVELSCEPACPPPPDCIIKACVTITPGDITDSYILILPTVGNVSVANGIITLPNNETQELPDDGFFCVPLPIFGPVTATAIFNGTGSVVIDVTYEDESTCTVFSAGVGSEEDVHVIQDVTLSCESSCPPPPDCMVKICTQFNDAGNDVFEVAIPGVGVVIFQNGVVTAPSGQFPLTDPFCVDVPVFSGALPADLKFIGYGSVVVTVIYPDETECEVFSAGEGTSDLTILKQELEIGCEAPCVPTCEIEICANFSPGSSTDVYKVFLPGGGELTITGGIVTLPFGQGTEEYNGEQYCATIEIEEGTTSTATLIFAGTGEVVTTIEYEDGGFCPIFKAGQNTPFPSKAKKEVTLGCTPIC